MSEKTQSKVWLGILAAALFLLQSASIAADPPRIPDGWSDGYVYANGVRLHYYRAVPAPDKPAIVMVHGVTDNGLCWTTLSWELQDDYDIYMLDTRGHGLSDPFTTADDGDTLIKDVVAAVQALGLENPILMGHSMGAATVMRVGAEYPDLARAVIMLDPGLPRPGAQEGRGARGAGQREGQTAGQREGQTAGQREGQTAGQREGDGVAPPPRRDRSSGEAAPEAAQRGARRGAPPEASPARDRLSVNMFGDPETLVAQNNYRFEDLVATGRRQSPKWDDVDIQYWALSKKQYHGAYTSDAWQAMSGSMRTGDALANIPVPALVLKADTSPEGRQSNEQAVEGMERVRLIHIDGAGHNLHHDERQRTVEALTEFLSAL